eukprot:SAG31_NODE_10293_length_1159_cov_1.013208_1_plen_187_part_10
MLDLAKAVAAAAGVWHNLTHDVDCFDIESQAPAPPLEQRAADGKDLGIPRRKLAAVSSSSYCPSCPPCTQLDGSECPPCPVSYCDWEDKEPCSFPGTLSKTFSYAYLSLDCYNSRVVKHLSHVDGKESAAMRPCLKSTYVELGEIFFGHRNLRGEIILSKALLGHGRSHHSDAQASTLQKDCAGHPW